MELIYNIFDVAQSPIALGVHIHQKGPAVKPQRGSHFPFQVTETPKVL